MRTENERTEGLIGRIVVLTERDGGETELQVSHVRRVRIEGEEPIDCLTLASLTPTAIGERLAFVRRSELDDEESPYRLRAA